MSVFVVELTGF
uniref:Uncharacterized protein n=1 Tax=Rhizophora mucronata TaxID=61149 RepID=A0A2P2PY25_RHIMU